MQATLSKRVALALAFATLLIFVLLYINGRRPVARLMVVQVMRGSVNSEIASNGKVEPVTPYSLRAKYDGFVDRVVASEGKSVRAGQLLLTMDDKDMQSQLDQARAQLATEENDLRDAQNGGRADRAAKVAGDLHTAEAQRDILQHQQETLTKLLAQKAATPEEVARSKASLERANVDLEQAQKAKQEFDRQASQDREQLALLVSHARAQVNDLRDKVASARVVAPVNGTLFSLPVHARDFVHTGDLLADVADLRQVRVRAYIDEPELGKLRPSVPVDVTWDALPDRTWVGHTENVPTQVVARGARNVGEVLCSVSNEHLELIPNTTVDVRIKVSEHPNVLTVPRGAVQIVGSHRYVFRLNGDQLHRTEIKVGISDAANFEVLAGVEPGTFVALPGDVPLKDNMVIRAVYPE
jgi:HlyD family secretion protein